MTRLRKGRPRVLAPLNREADKQPPGDKQRPSSSSKQRTLEAAPRNVDPRLGPFVARLAELLVADLLRVPPQKR